MYAIRDIEEIKERLLSFEKYAKDAQPEVLVTLIQTFVERIYITDENAERHCHIFIKGCTKEDYDDFFRATGYIENTRETGIITSVLSVCDLEQCCKGYEGSESRIPIVRIKPREYRRTCPFASKEGCRIHPVKPAVCALYPLGRMTNWETKEFTYFLQPVPCGNRKQIQTVRQWLEDFSILDEEEFTILWHQKIGEISEILRDMYQVCTFNHDPINDTLMTRLYMCCDLNKDFLDQFRNNCAEVLQALIKISKIDNV